LQLRDAADLSCYGPTIAQRDAHLLDSQPVQLSFVCVLDRDDNEVIGAEGIVSDDIVHLNQILEKVPRAERMH
jgi:hypothetical protein